MQQFAFLGIEPIGPTALKLKTLPNSRIFNFSHTIDGYSVNCRKTKLLVWGIPKNISSATPQIGAVTLIDIEKKKIIKSLRTGRGIMSIDYLTTTNAAQILMGYSTVMNLTDGSLKYLTPDEENKLIFEQCENFDGKQFLK